MAEKETPEFVDDVELDDLDEATAAADTLHPGAGSGGTESKAATLATFTSLLAQLGKEDLSKLFNDVQSQFGPGKAPGAMDKSAANKASVNAKASSAVGSGGPMAAEPMPKLSVKEDVAEMFGADDTLSEEFRERAEIVFEAALNTRLTLEETRLQEQYEAKEAELEEAFELALEEETANIFSDLSTKLDQYLDYVVEQWMEENQIAVDNGLRADIAENFLHGLQNLFAEHYIKVPENQMDLVAEMKAELDEVKAKLNEAIDEKLELQNVINEATMEATLEEVSEGLAETQIEKLRTLAEGIEFTDTDSYRRKLEIVKENYFTPKKASKSTGLITEEIDGSDDSETATAVPAHMAKYMQAISKSVK